MAIKKVTMPQLGESVTEGTINAWLVEEGDHVNKYDPIADVMTDKVNAEIPSSFSGTMKEIVVKSGETVNVDEIICYIAVEDGSEDEQSETTTIKKESTSGKKIEDEQSMKKRYSPAVLRMAQENNIDLAIIDGTGRGGRITRKDIERHISLERKSDIFTKTEQVSKEVKPVERDVVKTKVGDIEIPVTGVRKAIAQNTVRSKTEIPHAWMTVEVDVTDLVHYRNKLKKQFKEKEGFNLTYFPFFVKAVAQAISEYPRLNSTWSNDKIIQRQDINISIAIATDEELFVPVIKQADEKSIKGLAKGINDLAIKTREGNLSSADLQDGTFTVNNTGSFGSIHSMGIINHPQAAILQVESIVKRPVIINDMFAARDMVNLSLSLDHRILDGLICGRFLARIKEILEKINENNTNIY